MGNIERGMETTSRLDVFACERPGVISGVLHGDLPNKSNSRRVFRGMVIKSQEALDFVERVKLVASYSRFGEKLIGCTNLKDYHRGVPFIYLKAIVHTADLMRDLDVELLPDALQHAGVINNDKAIRPKFYWWEYDPQNPRVVFELGYFGRAANPETGVNG